MKLSTAKRRINKTLDELSQSVIDDWYANFKNGYIKGYADARQGISPMYAEAYEPADTPQTDEIGDCNSCEYLGDLRCGMCTNGSGYKRRADTPQTDCGWAEPK